MTHMESPKRKMQKKNDYQRHKLFRKIKRRRKAQAKADQQVAMKQLRKKLKLPKFGDGKGIKSETGAPLEAKDGMLYYKETGEPFYSAGLLLPEVEIIGDKSKVNPWAAAGRHNTSSYWDPNGVVHGFDKSVEAAINYPAMIMKQNGYDASGYYDKVSKIGKAMTTLSPTKWIGTLRGTGMPWEESNQGLYGGYGETGRAADQLFDIMIGSKIGEKFSDKIQNTKELLELSKENHNPFNNAFTRSILYSYLPLDIQYDLPFHIQDHKINIGLGRTPTPLENKIYPQLLQFHNSGKDINIKPSKRGTFTKAAKQHGMSVQGFANSVLRNPSKYSAAMRKKANFARNASKWNK